jgi:O-antigen/teichoic acid export membrane protein
MKKALLWKLMERFGVQGIQFVLQIILARLLDPEHYGVLSLMIVFTSLANVFIQNGLNTALIQNKEVTEEDYSSVFWVTLGMAGILYAAIFFGAPYVAVFYDMPDIILPLRVLALMLFPGAINSVQIAKVSKELDFRKVFTSNVLAIIVSGIIGITVALLGGGLWALVVQSLFNVVVACVVMLFTVRWKLRFSCDWERMKILFAFGWKLMVSGLLDTLYQDLRSLVIGKKYDSSTLGYYNRGKQFPQFIITAINGAVQSVMLPVMSKKQDDTTGIRQLTRISIITSSYLIFPLMAGLAGVAEPMVRLLLTDKWLPCVPYLQIYCFTLAFYPVHSCNLQAINAMGRSDIFLKLEMAKKTVGIIALIIAVARFNSPIAIALTGAVTTLISCFINATPNKDLIGYAYFEQMWDILPAFLSSILMLIAVLFVGKLQLPVVLVLVLQVFTGIAVYLLISVVTRMEAFRIIWDNVRNKHMQQNG